MSSTGRDARTDWETRIGRHTDVATYRPPPLAAPAGVRVSEGRGQVTVDWQPVDGAVGYLVERSAIPDGRYEPVEVGEPLVRAVPHPPFTDTTGTPGRPPRTETRDASWRSTRRSATARSIAHGGR